MTTKLILAVIRITDCDTLIHDLLDHGFRVTKFSSLGGFLRHKNTTLLIGLSADQVTQAITIIRDTCPTSSDSDEHNATIFVLDAGHLLHF